MTVFYIILLIFLALFAGMSTFVTSVNALHGKFPSYEHPVHRAITAVTMIFILMTGTLVFLLIFVPG